MSAFPEFKNNIENASIISGANIPLLAEIPDTQKAFIEVDKNGLTVSGVNFQAPNLNSFYVGQIEAIPTRTEVYKGTTVDPANTLAINLIPTTPYIVNMQQATVDGYCTNKSISEIKFNSGNKAWTESDRTEPEMIDMWASQFDKEKVASFGIYGDGDIRSSLVHNQDQVLGIPTVSPPFDRPDYIDTARLWLYGAGFNKNDYVNDKMLKNQPNQQLSKGYVVVRNVSWSGKTWNTGTSALVDVPTPLYNSYNCEGYEGIACPSTTPNGTVPYYVVPSSAVISGTGAIDDWFKGYIVQTITYEVHEYLISPFLSNPYSKNPHKKIYYTNGYPLNLTFQFNQNYLRDRFFKYQLNQGLKLSNSITGSKQVNHQLVSQTLTDYKLRLWTFDTAKPLPEQPMRTIYYKQEKQTSVVKTLTRASNGLFGQDRAVITTPNLSSMRQYAIVYCVAKPDNNNDAYFGDGSYNTVQNTNGIVLGKSTHPYCELLPLDKLEIKVGTQADTLGTCDLPMEELVKHCVDYSIKNPEWRDIIANRAGVECVRSTSLGTVTSVSNITKYAPKRSKNIGFPFYIIDIAKLNLRGIDGLPLVPRVNYGNTNFKAMTFTGHYTPTEQMQYPETYTDGLTPFTSLTVEFNVILMEQRIKTLPLFTGGMTDDPVEFQIENVSGDLLAKLNSGYSVDADNQLAYIGGAFTPYDFSENLKKEARMDKKWSEDVEDSAGKSKGKYNRA